MAKKKKKGSGDIGCPEWMMTMGDCMSLLLTFFVLLLTFSTVSDSKLMDVMGVMKGAFSVVEIDFIGEPSPYREEAKTGSKGAFVGDGEQKSSYIDPKDASPVKLHSMPITRRFGALSGSLSSVGMKHYVDTKVLNEGISLVVSTDKMFQEGTLKPTRETKIMLNEIANLTFNIGNEIRLLSYIKVDKDSPAMTKRWDLALKRSIKIGNLLNKGYKLPKSRFSYGTSVVGDEDKSDYIQIIIMEKISVKEMNRKDLLNFKNSNTAP